MNIAVMRINVYSFFFFLFLNDCADGPLVLLYSRDNLIIVKVIFIYTYMYVWWMRYCQMEDNRSVILLINWLLLGNYVIKFFFRNTWLNVVCYPSIACVHWQIISKIDNWISEEKFVVCWCYHDFFFLHSTDAKIFFNNERLWTKMNALFENEKRRYMSIPK